MDQQTAGMICLTILSGVLGVIAVLRGGKMRKAASTLVEISKAASGVRDELTTVKNTVEFQIGRADRIAKDYDSLLLSVRGPTGTLLGDNDLSAADLAFKLEVHETTVMAWANKGKIPAFPRKILIPRNITAFNLDDVRKALG
jgi:hypothetical protein